MAFVLDVRLFVSTRRFNLQELSKTLYTTEKKMCFLQLFYAKISSFLFLLDTYICGCVSYLGSRSLIAHPWCAVYVHQKDSIVVSRS